MKTIFKTATILLATVVLVACNSNKNTTTEGMKKHDDNNLSFEYPEKWSVKTLALQDDLPGATQYTLMDENDQEIFSMSVTSASSYSYGTANLDEYAEVQASSANEQELIRKELFKTSSGEEGYYLDTKRLDTTYADNSISVFLPAGEKKKYEINATSLSKKAAYEAYFKTDMVLNLLKSITIKVK